MLNQDICKACLRENGWNFNMVHKSAWAMNHLMLCPILELSVEIDAEVPNECLCVLEHIVMEESMNESQ